MSEQLSNFIKNCDKIQQKCACPSWDAYDCMRIRHPRVEFEELFIEDQRCECICHEEIAEEEDSQEWPL